mgnify:CR=1 FL=1
MKKLQWVNPNTEGQPPSEALQCLETKKVWRKDKILTINGEEFSEDRMWECKHSSHFGEGTEDGDGIHFQQYRD